MYISRPAYKCESDMPTCFIGGELGLDDIVTLGDTVFYGRGGAPGKIVDIRIENTPGCPYSYTVIELEVKGCRTPFIDIDPSFCRATRDVVIPEKRDYIPPWCDPRKDQRARLKKFWVDRKKGIYNRGY